jgi:aspartyl-tRNA(Asn)/glutamyl-tRNA(Gln) amidotransferase subunit C
MSVSIEQLEKIAELARLSLSDDEKIRYAQQLSVVLGYIDVLNEVDTSLVDETCQVTCLSDIVRLDEVRPSSEEERKKMIAQFPDKLGNLLRVKKVFSE